MTKMYKDVKHSMGKRMVLGFQDELFEDQIFLLRGSVDNKY